MGNGTPSATLAPSWQEGNPRWWNGCRFGLSPAQLRAAAQHPCGCKTMCFLWRRNEPAVTKATPNTPAMSRSWIKIETHTPHKPEICAIASSLRMDPDTVMGKLVRLWSWAEMNVGNDNVARVTIEFLDMMIGRKGFSAALERAGWLKQCDEGLIFPNFSRHNGKAAKVRAQTAVRVSKHRAGKRLGNDSAVTETMERSPATPGSDLNNGLLPDNNISVENIDNVQSMNELAADRHALEITNAPTEEGVSSEAGEFATATADVSDSNVSKGVTGTFPDCSDRETQVPVNEAETEEGPPPSPPQFPETAPPGPGGNERRGSRPSRQTTSRSLPPAEPPEQPLLF